MRGNGRWFGALAAVAFAGAAGQEKAGRNPALSSLEANRWVKIHEQKKSDPVSFMRQAHGGSCFDTRRGLLILFGSNTHGKDWKNSPFFFDPVKLSWSQAYPEDGRETYTVSPEGIPTAGRGGDRPWAMHTFGAVEYDPGRDEMVVACHPGHMVPGRFTDAVADLWPKIRRHPTWVFRCGERTWQPLPCDAVSFFPYCTAFDSDRGVVVGYGGNGVWELGGEPRRWIRVDERPLTGWHNNAVYDSRNRAVVVFGTDQDGDDVVVYRPGTREHRKMPTPGVRPPKDQHAPMAFEPEAGRTVVLADRKEAKATETWLYDLGRDEWTLLKEAELPFPCGMNYTLEYDPGHRVLLLVTGDYGSPTAVWALRIFLAGRPERKPAAER